MVHSIAWLARDLIVEPDFDRWLDIWRANIDRVSPRAASTDRVHESANPFLMLTVLEASAPPNAPAAAPTDGSAFR
jgi:hypothetical protein